MSHVESETLGLAVNRLYQVFERYPLRSKIVGCPCCVGDSDEEKLHSRPLRQLSSADLARYIFKAMTTWGDDEDFRHFLPRIFELTARDENFSIDVEIVFGKLHYGKWRNWPADEQSAIEAYFRSFWLSVISSHPHFVSADSCLCGIAQAVDDVRPYLIEWTRPSKPTVFQLCEFIVELVPTLIKRQSLGTFWGEHQAQVDQIITWLVEPATTAFLEQAYFDTSAEPASEEISQAVELLRALRAAIP